MLRVSRRLDDQYRVLRYDRRGYGRSTPHDGPFGMDRQVRRPGASCCDGRRAVVVGHSYGGNVALATAARHPELVAGVAIYETPMSWEPWWPGTTAGSVAIGGRPRGRRKRPRCSCAGSSATERWEELPERTRATRRAEGVGARR